VEVPCRYVWSPFFISPPARGVSERSIIPEREERIGLFSITGWETYWKTIKEAIHRFSFEIEAEGTSEMVCMQNFRFHAYGVLYKTRTGQPRLKQ